GRRPRRHCPAGRPRARLDLRARRYARREPAARDSPRLARLGARPQPAGRRHPRRRQPRRPGGARMSWARRRSPAYEAKARILVPFTGALDQRVLEAEIRIARAEEAVLVAAYLLVVPLQYPEDSAQKDQVARALPLLEAVEQAALKARVPVDARIE